MCKAIGKPKWLVKCSSFHIVLVFQVPLLYSEPSSEEAAVAVVKHPSKYPAGHEKYRGPLLINPGTSDFCHMNLGFAHSKLALGGPGESGVLFVLAGPATYLSMLSDEFDLIGFDPRGSLNFYRLWISD